MKKNILVLDDSPFMLDLIGQILKRADYEVTAVDNGMDACQKVKTTRFDLIITDLNMPGMDGLEFTRQVRTYPGCRFLPIIMISGEKDDEKVAIAKKMGVSTFLSKPIQEEQIKAILEIILNKRMTPRIPIKMQVFYRKNGSFSEFISSHTVNVSLGGLFIETDEPFPLGENLELKLSLPDSNPIICQGRVVWVISPLPSGNNEHPPGMGLAFHKLQVEKKLQQFLQFGNWKY
ncbi:MAG: TIGR02266 family protein [Desulfuromonadales bacterium]